LTLDNTAPVISIITPAGGEKYTAGKDRININFKIEDAGPYLYDAYLEIIEAEDESKIGEKYNVVLGDEILPLDLPVPGFYVMKVEAEDWAGHRSLTETNRFEVEWDIQPPRTAVSIASPKYIVEGSTYITSSSEITLSAVDDLVEIGDGIGLGVDYTLYRINEGPWEEYDVSITIPGEGINALGYYSVDVVGNTEEVRALAFKVDNTPPDSALNSGSPLYESAGIVYVSSETPHYLSSTDPVVKEVASGVDYANYKFDNGFWSDVQSPVEEYEMPEVLEEGIRTISYYAVDNVENTESENSKTFHVDTTAPETELSIAGVKYISEGKTYINASSRVKLTAADILKNEVMSGVQYTEYRIDGGPWQVYEEEVMLAEGIREVDYRSIDNVNNTENIKTFTLYVDDTPPVTSLHTDGPRYEEGDKTYINTGTVIDFTASDPVFNDVTSGVKEIRYKIDGGDFNLFNATFTLTEGIYTIKYYSTDNVENTESFKSKVFYVDGIPPETEISGGEPYIEVFNLKIISPDTPITLTANDPVSENVASGVDYTQYRIDEGNWLTYSEPFTLEAGTHRVDYKSVDNVDNLEKFKSRTYAVIYLTDYALMSESSLKISGNAEVYGDVRSNGHLQAEGNVKIDGDVAASTVTVSGENVNITGEITENADKINPWGIDLDEVKEWVIDNNDNEKLDLSGGVLKAAGKKEIVVSAGIYYLAGIDVSGQAKLTFENNVNIFLTGSFKTSGKANLETTGDPYGLIIFSNSDETDVISGQGSLESIIYAPSKFINVSGNGLSLGNMLARQIHVIGNAAVTGAEYEGEPVVVSAASMGLSSENADGEFKLGEIYVFPNPAKGSNPTIHFECGIADRVEVRIYNIAAELVHAKEISGSPQIVNGRYAYEYTWDTNGIASGVYLYLVRGQKDGRVLQQLKKMAVIK
ncbi:MAG: hypothetical protein U9R36_07260, partial [Elusimicrobiota bacterium]|nr:hypothetical protein [Elusimicrobiota bacterium]